MSKKKMGQRGPSGRDVFIDVGLWDRAGWMGTAFTHDLDGVHPPAIGLLYGNGSVGEQIFRGLRARIGPVDIYDELHVSIIEGDIPNEPPGYTVHIGTRIEGIQARAKAEGRALDRTMSVISRLHRMNPQPGSPHLATFKEQFERFRLYSIMPISQGPQGLELHPELGIEKRVVHFKRADQLGSNDIDIAALGKTPSRSN